MAYQTCISLAPKAFLARLQKQGKSTTEYGMKHAPYTLEAHFRSSMRVGRHSGRNIYELSPLLHEILPLLEQ